MRDTARQLLQVAVEHTQRISRGTTQYTQKALTANAPTCRLLTPAAPCIKNTNRWHPPTQVLRRQGATSKSDVYSFGVVLWECLSRRVPWEDVTDVKLLSSSVKRGERPAVPEDAPADLADLARLCWAGDPYERPTLDRVLADVLDAAHDAAGAVDAAVS